MKLRIIEQRLPGIGHRYELVLGGGQRLVVVVEQAGGRELGVFRSGTEEPEHVVHLSQEQAVAVAALLSGARFAIERAETPTSPVERETADVAVETVTLGPDSPAVGRLSSDLPLLNGADAAVLAVIRDETPELVEDQERVPCRPGDRVVVAARRDRLGAVVAALAG